MKKKVTIKDIANYAGVSPSTVSRVLNGYPFIKSETKDKVSKVIDEFNFKPDEIARSLIKKKTKTLGLIIDDITNPFFAETSKIIINNARKRGYEVLLYDTDGQNNNLEDIIDLLRSKQVSGIIAGSISRHEVACEKLHESGFPIVLFNRRTENSEIFSVTMNNEKGGRMAVEHLIDKGHKNIAYLSGSLKLSTFHDRYLGYKNALKNNDIEYDEELVYFEGSSNSDIHKFVTKVLDKNDRPTAFIGSSDNMSITALDAITSKGFEIPKDVGVIGFDNIDISANPYIGLTTISQQKSKIADLALQRLIDLIEKDTQDIINLAPIIVEPKLITRKTT